MAKTFEAILSVLDKASQPILDLEEKLKKLAAQGKSTQHSLVMSPHQKLWNELTEHVNLANEKFKGLGENIGEMGARLGEVLPMLGAVGGIGSAAGLIELAHATAEAAEALANVSKITGVAVPQLQALDFAGKQVGVTSDQLALGLERLNVNIGKAAEGQDKQAAALFKAMGISLKDANGHVKSAAQLLPQMEASFEKTKDPALRAAMAMTLFGRSGVELLPFLTQGPDAIAKMQAKFKEFGYGFTDEDQEGLEKFNDAWKDSQLAVEGLGDAIGASLAPVLAPMLEDFAVFISQNRDLISADLKSVFKGIGDELSKVDFKTVAGDAKAFAGDVEDIINDVGGLKVVMVAAGLAVTADFLSPLILLTTQMGKLAFSMGAPLVGAVAGFGADVIALAPEVKSLRDVMVALDLAFEANPFGAAATAAGLFAAAGLAIYENWKSIEGFLDGIFQKIGEVSDAINDFEKKFGLGFGGDAFAPQAGPGYSGYPLFPGASSAPAAPAANPLFPKTPLISPQADAGNGKVDVHVKFANAPAGTAMAVKSSGVATTRVTNTGRNSLGYL